ncbi:hypothetical protein ACGFQG_20485 [Nocardia fluminea]|uniref:hypothetical protein n=1 Tax=Nocardia fluminea TaxID=134984 RepID=UPI003719E768
MSNDMRNQSFTRRHGEYGQPAVRIIRAVGIDTIVEFCELVERAVPIFAEKSRRQETFWHELVVKIDCAQSASRRESERRGAMSV